MASSAMRNPRNASLNKTYLTKNNNTGGHLLRTVHGKSQPASSQPTESSDMKSSHQKREKSVDTDAEPQSSSDEDERVLTPPPSIKASETSSAKRKNSSAFTTDAKRKRRRLQDTPSFEIPDNIQSKSTTGPDLFDVMLQSSASQSRRKSQKTYGSKKEKASTESSSFKSENHVRPVEKGLMDYTMPDILSPTESKDMPKDFLKIVEPLPPPLPSSIDGDKPINKFKTFKSTPDQTGISQEDPASFYIPPELDLDVLSNPTSASSITRPVFELPDSSPLLIGRNRSGSTSSLSSVDSVISLELDDNQKADLSLENNDSLMSKSRTSLHCPLCRKALNAAQFDFISPRQLTGMTIKKQQAFCVEHRRKDAMLEWKTAGYPQIDWAVIEKKRIPSHESILRKILHRKQDSFYLAQLDAQIKSSRRNPKMLQTFMKEGLVDLVKHGYFGPKGANNMANTIIAKLRDDLNQTLNSDPTLAKVGVGSFVGIVLVPELMTRLVMADMGVKTPQEARAILADSSDIGTLLNADDDNVELEVDDT